MTITTLLLITALLSGIVFFFSSCKTYYIPVDSFKKQLGGFDSSDLREVSTKGPLGERVKYTTYPIDYIQAIDKNGKPVSIPNGPAIEVRITDSSNKKNIFYFDLIQFDGANIIGRQSRIIPTLKKTLPINTVKSIEVQNGRKKYRYIQ